MDEWRFARFHTYDARPRDTKNRKYEHTDPEHDTDDHNRVLSVQVPSWGLDTRDALTTEADDDTFHSVKRLPWRLHDHDHIE